MTLSGNVLLPCDGIPSPDGGLACMGFKGLADRQEKIAHVNKALNRLVQLLKGTR